jgi:hypothetical protein
MFKMCHRVKDMEVVFKNDSGATFKKRLKSAFIEGVFLKEDFSLLFARLGCTE